MLRGMLLWASENPWLSRRLPRLGFVRRAVSRLMPGEDVASALAATAELNGRKIGAVLTLLGENLENASEAEGVVRHYLDVMEAIAARRLDAEVSVKLTHLGLDLDPAMAEANLVRLVRAAAGHGQDLWVDMESSAYTRRTLDMFGRVRAQHENVGLALQSYLRSSDQDLEALLPLRPMIRLVKGAYAEPAAIAYPDKGDVDRAYERLAHRLLESAAAAGGPREILGTHDRRIIASLIEWAGERELAPGAYEIHMLYGIQREEQLRLVGEGRRVMVLISYGSAWFPWYMRRLAERPANLWFVLRNLFG
ncbi:MAG: proline dehydrogenase family protein [Candidatus Eisenbacteria bacterium]|uniref:proline dehydrogenase n=1 Tax=Eiseniibacteriota bacterium TaxID=2212470 RepID=A0A9D6L5F5_UNCEI|nr:proline dehydrogenase family protein [Candidatus Eisenbacteria bacterium]MBI3539126.1 proline dehydrogenase family protein [Candidatus Eisenbacteria bacterium]